MNALFGELKKKLPSVRKNAPMKNHTTFKIGGPAEYFFIAKDKKQVLLAITSAKKLGVPIFTFGGGSNLLVSDQGIKGLVVKIQNKNLSVKKNIITADAGVEMKDLVAFSIKNSLQGLEWAGGLPGTFGGAVRGNAGAFGREIKDSVLEVEGLAENFTVKKFSKNQCGFSYRNSIFKEKGWMILSATLAFKKGDKKALQGVAQSRIQYRKERHPLEYGSAGSVFKNVDVKTLSPEFQKEFADKVKQDPFPIVPAAWLIIGAGLTGKRIGNAQISTKHSNYIVNLGNAKAEDVLALIELAQEKIKEKYNIRLEVEVQTVGF